MSLSINNYYNKSYYDLTSESTGTSPANSTSGTKNSKGTDSVDFSEIAKQFFTLDGTDDDTEASSSLFQAVPSSFSYKDKAQEASGIPSMLQAMGGFPPPFAWGLNDTESTDDSESTDFPGVNSLTSLEAGLTSDDMKSVLEHLQGSLSLSGTGDSSSASTDNPLAALKAMLSKINFSDATDSDLSSLFSNVLQTIA